MPIEVLNFGLRQIAILLLVSLFVSGFSSGIPVRRFSKQKPIDVIKIV